MTYIIFIGCILFLLSMYKISKNKIYFLFTFILITFFSGFRFQVGTDYNGYEKLFYMIPNNLSNFRGIYLPKELGYRYLVKVVSALGFGQQIVFFIYTVCTYFFLYKFIENFSKNKILNFLMYICIGSFF